MPNVAQSVAAQIRRLRVAQGLSQEQLAEGAGLSRDGLARVERGDREPRLVTLEAIADGLGVPLRDLFVGEPVSRQRTIRSAKSLRLRRVERYLERLDDAEAERVVRAVAALSTGAARRQKKG